MGIIFIMETDFFKSNDITNQIHAIQNKRDYDLASTAVSATTPDSSSSEQPHITRQHLIQFKDIIYTFLDDTAPQINAKNMKGTIRYETNMSKKRVELMVYSSDSTTISEHYKFHFRQFKLTNEKTQEETPEFMFHFLKYFDLIFKDISSKEAIVKEGLD